MASVTLTFSAPLNVSCQVGDTAYFTATSTSGEFTTDGGAGLTEIGQIREVVNPTSNTPAIICDTSVASSEFGSSPFIAFGKDRSANTSSILGYYAETKFVCDDTSKAELFAINTSIFESSK